jgi:hypothetical protein
MLLRGRNRGTCNEILQKGNEMMSFLHASRFAGAALASFMVALPAFAQPVSLGSAETFAVLGSTSVTSSGTTVLNGDLGVFPGTTLPAAGAVTLGTGASRHLADAVAAQAAAAVDEAFSDLASRICTPANTLTTSGGVYAGGTLATPGVYCFDQDNVQINGNITLTGPGEYVFKIAGTLATAASVQVRYQPAPTTPSACSGSNVIWRVAGTTVSIGANNVFLGTLLAHEDVTLGTGTTVDGRVLSHEGDVVLANNTVTACTDGRKFPAYTAIKVTGGGSIPVQGAGRQDFANYGFNAHPGGAGVPATGSFNYLNHTQGPPPYHLRGTVTDVDVVDADNDGVAQTVRFSGTCDGISNCTFSAMVQDNGEPGRDDQFGVTVVVNGSVVEEQDMRQVRNGNIQFHTSTLTTEVNAPVLRGGQTLQLSARLRRDRTVATPADAYVVLRMPGGQMLSWTGSALVPGLAPVARNFIPVDLDVVLLRLQVPLGTPAGTYTWMSVLTDAGTLNLRSSISERSFTVQP